MTVKPNSHFLDHIRLLLELHKLFEEDLGDEEQADAIRDKMDETWEHMSSVEKERARWLSADLDTLSEGGPEYVEMNKIDQIEWKEKIAKMWEHREFDSVLSSFRNPVPKNIQRDIVPFYQARIWHHYGSIDSAFHFMKIAENNNPSSLIILNLLLLFSDALGKDDEVIYYANKLLSGKEPSSICLAAATKIEVFHRMNRTDNTLFQDLIPTLRNALNIVNQNPSFHQDPIDLFSDISLVLGYCLEQMGDSSAALKVYDEALDNNPNDIEILQNRGLLRYETNTGQYLMDLEKATNLGTKSAWVYAFIAQKAFFKSDFRKCWDFSIQALKYQPTSELKAQVYEWLGICQSMLGQSIEMVNESFARALECDPNNLRIRSNWETAKKKNNKQFSLQQSSDFIPLKNERLLRFSDTKIIEDSMRYRDIENQLLVS